MKRRCLSFLLALCMLLTFLPASALADENPAADTDAAPPEIADASATQESAENSDLASETALPPEDANAAAVETTDASAEEDGAETTISVASNPDNMAENHSLPQMSEYAKLMSDTSMNADDDEDTAFLMSTSLPSSIFLAQVGNTTCTLSAAAMMLRARMYLSGNGGWSSISESSIRSTAWIESRGLRQSFKYVIGDNSMTVAHADTSGISVSSLKSILNQHPEGIILYCGKKPHAVFLTDYDGDTFYCADPLSKYAGSRLTLDSSYLGSVYGTQASILSNTTAYWYIASYSISGSPISLPDPIPNPVPTDDVLLDPIIYNSGYYYAANYDVQLQCGNDAAALQNNWLTQGSVLGRPSSQCFSVSYYREHYGDLSGYDTAFLARHFIQNGLAEGRVASEHFNLGAYKANYGDLQDAFGENLYAYAQHYIYPGWDEQRVANRKIVVRFDAAGGSCDTAEQPFTYRRAYGNLPTPTRAGYAFDGWYTGDGTPVSSETIANSMVDHMLYAHWTGAVTPISSGNDPKITLDEVFSPASGTLYIRGWAYDPDNTGANLGIHVYATDSAGNTSWVTGFGSGVSRQDVDNVWHCGPNHGIEELVPVSLNGTYTIHVCALGCDAAGNQTGVTQADWGGVTVYPASYMDIQDGVYMIETAQDYLLLDVAGQDVSTGANVHLLTNRGLNSQRFAIGKIYDGFYTFAPIHSGKIMSVAYGASATGVSCNVMQYDWLDASIQKWRFMDAGNGYVYIQSACGAFLDVQGGVMLDGTNVGTFTFNGSYAQKFRLIPSSRGGTIQINEGDYMLASALNESKVVDISGKDTSPGANAQLWENLNLNSQKFHIAKSGAGESGQYILTALHSGQALDVAGAGRALPTNVQQWSANGHQAQSWSFEDAGDGYVYLHSGVGNYLDVDGSSSTNGTNIQTYAFNGSNAQKFRLIPTTRTEEVFYLDLNGFLEGETANRPNFLEFGNVDLYINGQLASPNICDYYSPLNPGDTYEFKNVTAKPGYSFVSLHTGQRVGVMQNHTEVAFGFRKNTPPPANFTLPEKRVFNGHTYYFIENASDWYAARDFCAALGGYLACVTSEAEKNFIQSIIEGKSIWLGGSDVEEERNWTWLTGESFSYDNWHPGGGIYVKQPDNNSGNDEGAENYILMYGDGYWHDGNGAVIANGFVLEIPSADITVSFDANGGAVSPASKTVNTSGNYGELPLPTPPTRAGYVFDGFDGWYTEKDGGKEVTEETKVTETANHTLYAHWRWKTERTLLSVEIVSFPDKTSYFVGDSFDLTGLRVKAVYSDGSSETVTDGFTVSGFDSSAAGTKTVTIVCMGKNITFPVTIQAANNGQDNPSGAQIAIDNQTVSSGSTFTVPVLLKNNPGVIGFSFAVEYDAEKLEYVSAADADFTGIAANVNAEGNQLGFAFSSASKTNLVGEKIVKLTFRVKSGATGSANLSFIIDETFGDGFSAFNSDTQKNEPVSVSIKNGEISIADFIPGDVDGSGRVDNEDLILLTRYRARWKVSINMDAADVDGSGKVDNEDLILLTRYRARWKVTLLPGKVSSGGSATLKSSPPEKVGGQIALTSETANVNPGSEFDVEVLLKDNPGVIGFSFAMEYDAEKLEYLGATDGDFSGIAENIGANDGQLGFAYSSASETNNTGAVIARLKFKARDSANGKAELSIVIDEDFGDGFSAFNPETQINESIAFTPVGIGITVNGTQDALYTVTVEDGSGSGEYKAGDAVSIVADSLPDGVAFDKWTGADNLQFISGNQNSATATFVMPNYDVTLSPSYRINAQGCYVATAVYGSYDCPEVWTLRRFRDDVLAKTWYGRLFIRLYYAVSPTAVKWFGDCEWFRNFFRDKLDSMVFNLQEDGFASTPYQDRDW